MPEQLQENSPQHPDDAGLFFFARLWLALVCLFRITFDGAFAARVSALREVPAAPLLPAQARPQRPTLPATPSAISAAQLDKAGQALHLLALLQREGRLLDFVEEDLAGFPDAQIGAAARTVHAGCRKALHGALSLSPIRLEKEGAAISVPGGFDPAAIRLSGNLAGNPPFKGTLKHHGWKVTEIRLGAGSGPADPLLVAPAEVELP